MKKVAVCLSGCGVFDGSEIYESVFTLLALERAGATVQCVAPDIMQHHVINHATQEEMSSESRNVLVESARLARGNIKSVDDVLPDDFDALVFPGGFGAAKNLCNFATQSEGMVVIPSVLGFARAFAEAGKPIGYICIAPVMVAAIHPDGTHMTIGNDVSTAARVGSMGAKHINCIVTECVVDKQQKVVSTPAYMLANSMSEAAEGIEALVDQLLAL